MEFKPKILLADDQDLLQDLYREYLSPEGYILYHAYNGKEALEIAKEGMPHVIVLDINMPIMTGFEVCAELRKEKSLDNRCIMFLTERDQLGDKVKGLELGADDYLCKPFEGAEFVARIKSLLRIVKLQLELEEANRELKYLADHDYLTDLYNMRFFYREMESQVAHLMKSKGKLACVLFDLDHFKQVVDEKGHPFGSQMLAEIGGIIKTSIQVEGAMLGRYGGDEFIFTIPGMEKEGVTQLVEGLLAALKKNVFKFDSKVVKGISASFGISFLDNPEVKGTQDLIRVADDALFEAKRKGRGCYVL